MLDLASIRREYARAALDLEHTDPDPFRQFSRWMEEAQAAGIAEPTAMTVATADREGRPDARVVLLKGVDRGGFVFYTNYRSRKGRELAANPAAALNFWWAELERQVRILGTTVRVDPGESEAYFRSRPRDSQLSAWISPQSEVVAGRAGLEQARAEAEARFAGQEVPRPEHWGGVRVMPAEFEFWQGRPGRLHDRIHYTPAPGGAWHRERLAP